MSALEEGLQELRAALQGRVLLPGDGQPFLDALRVWAVGSAYAAGPRPAPAVVVQPRGTADVAAAVKWAVARGLPLAVKCGGHGRGNPCWIEGGLLVDLCLMRSVYVDPVARTAVVDGGALACDVDAETALYGLATPLGICSVVGAGGLALNGGISLLSRAYGATADNILEATLVLADGSVVNVTPSSDPELHWAMRGAGTALGVATKIKLQLHDVSNVHCGAMVWRDEPGQETLKVLLRFVRDVVLPNPAIGFNIARATDPQLGPLLVSMVVLTDEGTAEDRTALLGPLRELGPIRDTVGSASWLETQSTHAAAIAGRVAAFPEQYESWAGGHIKADQLSDACINALVRWMVDEVPAACHTTLSFFELLGGRLDSSEAPVGWQGDVQWVVQVGWTDPACCDEGEAFAAAMLQALAPFSASLGSYVNMLDCVAMEAMTYDQAVLTVRGAGNLERLVKVKQRVDPTNVFRRTPHAAVLAAGTPIGQAGDMHAAAGP